MSGQLHQQEAGVDLQPGTSACLWGCPGLYRGDRVERPRDRRCGRGPRQAKDRSYGTPLKGPRENISTYQQEKTQKLVSLNLCQGREKEQPLRSVW